MHKTIIHGAGVMARGLVFVLMLFFRPLVAGATGLVAGVALIGVLGVLLFARDQVLPLIAFLSAGLSAVAIGFVYNWVLMMLAPAGFTMLMDDA